MFKNNKEVVVYSILSFTWGFVYCLKKNKEEAERSKFLKMMNWIYFSFSIMFTILLITDEIFNTRNGMIIKSFWVFKILVIGYFISRCNEVFISYSKDAFDKLTKKPRKSNIVYADRLKMAFRSYLELILDFAIIYYLLPNDYWQGVSVKMSDFIFYSGSILTTLGTTQIEPDFWLTNSLTLYQVFCAFSLIVLCLTIYSSEEEKKNNNVLSS